MVKCGLCCMNPGVHSLHLHYGIRGTVAVTAVLLGPMLPAAPLCSVLPIWLPRLPGRLLRVPSRPGRAAPPPVASLCRAERQSVRASANPHLSAGERTPPRQFQETTGRCTNYNAITPTNAAINTPHSTGHKQLIKPASQ